MKKILAVLCMGFAMQAFAEPTIEKLQKACELGDGAGCFNLGVAYYDGKGLRMNEITAKEYFGKACDLGDQDGCDNYAKLHKAGVK